MTAKLQCYKFVSHIIPRPTPLAGPELAKMTPRERVENLVPLSGLLQDLDKAQLVPYID